MRCIDADALIKDVLDLQNCYNGFSDTYDKACIIGLIDEQPTIEPPYELDEWCTDCREYDRERNCCPRYNQVIRDAAAAVKANFTPKQGRWIECDHDKWSGDTFAYRCSECGGAYHLNIEQVIGVWNYCPNCGARMEEVTDDGC